MNRVSQSEPTKTAAAPSAGPAAQEGGRAPDALPSIRALVATLSHPVSIVGALSRDERRALVRLAAAGEEDGGDPET